MEYYFCERTSDALWAEPLNVISSAGLLIAAILLFFRIQRHNVPLLMVPVTTLAVMGFTSASHHINYNDMIYQFDNGLLALFILSYMYAGHRLFWGQTPRTAFLWTLAFVPMAGVLVPLFHLLPASEGYATYAPFPVILMVHSMLMRDQYPETADGIFFGAALLVLGLVTRTLDLPVCDQFPLGTHFIWQILVAINSWWMLEVLVQHYNRERIAITRRELLQSLDNFAMY